MNLHEITPPLPTEIGVGVHIRLAVEAPFARAIHGATGRVRRSLGGWPGMWAIDLDTPTGPYTQVHAYAYEVEIIP